MHPAIVAAGNRWPTCSTTHGEHDAIGVNRGSVAQLDGAEIGLECGYGALGEQAHALVVVPLRRLGRNVFVFGAAGEMVLGFRWPLVGKLAGINQCQLTVDSTGSQLSDGANAGDAASDDDDAG